MPATALTGSMTGTGSASSSASPVRWSWLSRLVPAWDIRSGVRPSGKRGLTIPWQKMWCSESAMPMSPGRKTPSPACSVTWWQGGSASSMTWEAPTALSTLPAPALSAPSTWPAWNSPRARPTWWSPAASTPSTTYSCTCASARPRPSPPAGMPGPSMQRQTGPFSAKGWGSW